jgi:hypothetical protein
LISSPAQRATQHNKGTACNTRSKHARSAIQTQRPRTGRSPHGKVGGRGAGATAQSARGGSSSVIRGKDPQGGSGPQKPEQRRRRAGTAQRHSWAAATERASGEKREEVGEVGEVGEAGVSVRKQNSFVVTKGRSFCKSLYVGHHGAPNCGGTTRALEGAGGGGGGEPGGPQRQRMRRLRRCVLVNRAWRKSALQRDLISGPFINVWVGQRHAQQRGGGEGRAVGSQF